MSENQAGRNIWRGLVGERGASGGSAGGGRWDLIFHLAAWKEPDGLLREGGVRCLLPVGAKENLNRWDSFVKPLALLEMEVDRWEGESLLLRDIGPLDADPDLEKAREIRDEPVFLDDPVLGELWLNRAYDWYEGEAVWGGETVEICLKTEEDPSLALALATAHELLRDQELWKERARHAMRAVLLSLEAGKWPPSWAEAGTPATVEETVERVRLNSIEIWGRSFTLWHDDGGFLGGHALTASGDLDSPDVTAEIEG